MYSDSRIERFNRSIYLSLVDQKEQNIWQMVSDKETLHQMLGGRIDRITTHTYDRTNIYRLCDKLEVIYNRFGTPIGKIYHDREILSCWIKKLG